MSVAIVIPLFNHERYIADALRSVLAQTRPPDRVIVIDDGSSDGSIEAARSVADSRIEVIAQANAGAHAALNRGIELATDCEFVGILNSDDLYEPERIEACLRQLEANTSKAIAVTRLRIIDGDGAFCGADDARVRWMGSVWQARRPSLPAWLGIANFTKTTSNLFGRTEFFRAHPFKPYRYIHDYYFALEAALDDELTVLDLDLLRYRMHGANTIKSGPAEKLPREVLRMNMDLLRAFAPALAEHAEIRARLAEYFRTLSRNYADFRLEPFLSLIATRVAPLSELEIEKMCEALDPAEFPELVAKKSRALREDRAQADCEKLLRNLAASRWLGLGRLIGAGPRLLIDAPTAEARLSAYRKACTVSKWYRLGEAIGFVYRD